MSYQSPIMSFGQAADVVDNVFPLQGQRNVSQGQDGRQMVRFTRSGDTPLRASRLRVEVQTAPGVGEDYQFYLMTAANQSDELTSTGLSVTISDTDTTGEALGVVVEVQDFCALWMYKDGPLPTIPMRVSWSLIIESDGQYQVLPGPHPGTLASTTPYVALHSPMGFGEAVNEGGVTDDRKRKLFAALGFVTLDAYLGPLFLFDSFEREKGLSTPAGNRKDGQLPAGFYQLNGFPVTFGDWVQSRQEVNSVLLPISYVSQRFFPDTATEGVLAGNGTYTSSNPSGSTVYGGVSQDAGSLAATEESFRAIVPIGMRLSHLIVASAFLGSGKTVTATLRKNGVDTALTASITGFARNGADVANVVTVVPGDVLTMKFELGGAVWSASTAPGWMAWGLKFAANIRDSDIETELYVSRSGLQSTVQTELYVSPPPTVGYAESIETEMYVKGRAQIATELYVASATTRFIFTDMRVMANLGDGEGWSGPWHLGNRA